MSKLVLLSIILATIIVPHHLAKLDSRAKGYKKLKLWMGLSCAFYIILLLYVYPRVAN